MRHSPTRPTTWLTSDDNSGNPLRATWRRRNAPCTTSQRLFAGSAAQLSDFMTQGVGPATQQLTTLHETLAGLEDAVDAIKNFSHARADMDRLSDTLARAAEISVAISALPDQIRNILDRKLPVDHKRRFDGFEWTVS